MEDWREGERGKGRIRIRKRGKGRIRLKEERE